MPKVETSNLGPVELANVQDAMRHRHHALSRQAADMAQSAQIMEATAKEAGWLQGFVLRYHAWILRKSARIKLRDASDIRAMLRAGREEVYVHRYGRRALHRQAGGR